MNWGLWEELTDHLSNEMMWENCRSHVLEFWMQYYFKKGLSEDLVLWAYLYAMEQLGLEEMHCT